MIIENYLHFHKIQWKCGDASFDFGSNPDHITLGFLGLGLGGGGHRHTSHGRVCVS